MKRFLSIFFLMTLFSCSSDSSDANSKIFEVQFIPSKNNVVVDESFTIALNANDTIKSIWVSYDNFATGGYTFQNFGSNFILNFNFDSLGQKVVYIRCQNSNNQVSEKQVTINVTRGNAIKINGIQIISFQNINGTFDSEYSASDPNRLADLQFGFAKSKLVTYLSSDYIYTSWYRSIVLENQGTMTWDVSGENLYINPNNMLHFGLVDIDNGIAGADLLNGPPDYRNISFNNYLSTKPSTIDYTFPEINLKFKLFVDWTN